ncbi:hypothetical protein FB645_006321, partial [Coemansia sp. IMI 203386]
NTAAVVLAALLVLRLAADIWARGSGVLFLTTDSDLLLLVSNVFEFLSTLVGVVALP